MVALFWRFCQFFCVSSVAQTFKNSVSFPLKSHVGLKLKEISLLTNLLNNVLLPSFSAAAEIPPSLMIQLRTTLPSNLSLFLSRYYLFLSCASGLTLILSKKKKVQ